MNKTVTINIAGFVYHIDEDAYNRLDNYLNAVKNSIRQDGEEEIIADIESRIGELFSERIDVNNGVIRMTHVDEIINIMGKPEDYIISDEPQNTESFQNNNNFNYNFKQPKKIYRDGERKILGGVCSGMGHYLGVDAVWLRIIFLLLLFVYGTSILVYFILWIIIPKARTTSEILEMKGETVNISNIEKQFKDGIPNYYNFNENGATAANVIRKIIGFTLIAFSSIGIVSSFFAPIVFNSQRGYLYDYTQNESLIDLPYWAVNLSLFLSICIPFIILLLLGIKIIKSKIKHIGLVAAVLGFIWLISVFIFGYGMVNTDINYAKFKSEIQQNFDTKRTREEINIGTNDTLKVIFDKDPRIFTVNDTIQNGYTYSELDDIELEILESTNGKTYFEINEMVFNKSKFQIRSKIKISGHQKVKIENINYSNNLNYNYSIKNDTLALSNTLLATSNKYTEDNKVKIKLYLQPNQTVQLNGRDESFIEDIAVEPGTNFYKFKNGYLTKSNTIIN